MGLPIARDDLNSSHEVNPEMDFLIETAFYGPINLTQASFDSISLPSKSIFEENM